MYNGYILNQQANKMEHYINHYNHCDTEWEDDADSMCNDRCPVCDKEIEPYSSEEITDD